jgi:hypothetical protein
MILRLLLPKVCSPFEYVRGYHKLSLNDSGLGITGEANITRYIAGWKPDNNTEYWQTMAGLAKLLGKRSTHQIPNVFTIPDDPRVNPTRQFLKESLRRAYEGRGSPDEFRDATHIAFLVKRFKHATEAKGYAEKWFGQDCNSFVANYHGISPSTAIFAYALGYGKAKKLLGASADIYDTRDLMPLPPISRLDQITQGTVMCVYGPPADSGSHWRHIAVVEKFVPTGSKSGLLSSAGWGVKGGYEAHTTEDKKVDLNVGDTNPELHGKKLVTWNITYEGVPAKYIFFDASPLDGLYSRGFHVGTSYGN